MQSSLAVLATLVAKKTKPVQDDIDLTYGRVVECPSEPLPYAYNPYR
jgi:hypothetical protein